MHKIILLLLLFITGNVQAMNWLSIDNSLGWAALGEVARRVMEGANLRDNQAPARATVDLSASGVVVSDEYLPADAGLFVLGVTGNAPVSSNDRDEFDSIFAGLIGPEGERGPSLSQQFTYADGFVGRLMSDGSVMDLLKRDDFSYNAIVRRDERILFMINLIRIIEDHAKNRRYNDLRKLFLLCLRRGVFIPSYIREAIKTTLEASPESQLVKALQEQQVDLSVVDSSKIESLCKLFMQTRDTSSLLKLLQALTQEIYTDLRAQVSQHTWQSVYEYLEGRHAAVRNLLQDHLDDHGQQESAMQDRIDRLAGSVSSGSGLDMSYQAMLARARGGVLANWRRYLPRSLWGGATVPERQESTYDRGGSWLTLSTRSFYDRVVPSLESETFSFDSLPFIVDGGNGQVVFMRDVDRALRDLLTAIETAGSQPSASRSEAVNNAYGRLRAFLLLCRQNGIVPLAEVMAQINDVLAQSPEEALVARLSLSNRFDIMASGSVALLKRTIGTLINHFETDRLARLVSAFFSRPDYTTERSLIEASLADIKRYFEDMLKALRADMMQGLERQRTELQGLSEGITTVLNQLIKPPSGVTWYDYNSIDTLVQTLARKPE